MVKMKRFLYALLLAVPAFLICSPDARAAGPSVISYLSTYFAGGTNGQVWTQQTSGTPQWANAVGGAGPWTLSGGVISPTVAGNQVSNPLGNATSEAFGNGAGGGASAANNASFGGNALSSVSNGSDNVSVGYNSLGNCTSGSGNTAVGSNALLSMTVSGQDKSTGVGFQALASNTRTSMVGIGYQAGYAPAGVSANANTTGTLNTYLGFQTGANSTTQRTNTTTVGYQALSTADNQVSLGDLNVTTIHIAGPAAIEFQGDTGISRAGAPGYLAFGNGAAGDITGNLKFQGAIAHQSATGGVSLAYQTDGIQMGSTAPLQFSPSDPQTAADGSISRISSSVLALGNGTLGDKSGTLACAGLTLTVTSSTSGTIALPLTSTHNNVGAGGSVTFMLPHGPPVGTTQAFRVVAAQNLVVSSQAGDTVYLGVTSAPSGGTWTSNTPGSTVTVEYQGSSTWVATQLTGTWTHS